MSAPRTDGWLRSVRACGLYAQMCDAAGAREVAWAWQSTARRFFEAGKVSKRAFVWAWTLGYTAHARGLES